MRRTIIAVALLLLALTLIACGPAGADTRDGPANVGQDDTATEPFTTSETDTVVQAGAGPAAATFPADTAGRALTSLGNPNAPVVMVEYSDYQCPFCRRHMQQTMPQLKAEFIDTGRVYYVFKDMPLASLHPLAYRLHEAALCVGEAGGSSAYWQTHDLFFERAELFQRNSEEAMDAAILPALEEAGLPDIADCLAGDRFAAEVQEYVAEGQGLGVRGTPSFFINGNLLVGAQPLEAFRSAIEQVERGEALAVAPPAATPAPPLAPTPAAIEARPLTALGDPNAPVTIVEYSDYQCPYCRRHFLETIPQLKENFIDSGRLYYVFKDMPLAGLHPLAYRLHEAALCVGEAGGGEAYWQTHDLFFEQGEAFQVQTLAEMDEAILTQLEAAGLPEISDCLAGNDFAAEVQAGVAEGSRLGVNGTPAFFINGYPIRGAQPYDLFEYAIGLAEEGKLEAAYQPPTGPNDGKAQEAAAAEAVKAAEPVDVPLGDAPALGSPDAPVTIVEYSDYQCPYCLRHAQSTLPLLQEYIDAGVVRYIFKDFPISSIHPQAQKAHEAARCARELGGDEAYWTMHDLLFEYQQSWATPPLPEHTDALKELVAEAGLPQAEFDECLDSGRHEDAVLAELAEGTELGVRGTPAFFLNGRPLSGAQPIAVFRAVIEQLLAEGG